MKKKIAIIGANEFQRPLIMKAREKGLETHVFAWKQGAVGAMDADCFYPISIVEKETILKKCQEIGISGITSIASDLAVVTVNYVAEKLGLPGNGIIASDWCTNKYLMRIKLAESGIPVPRFMKVHNRAEVDLENLHFPIIVKPTDRSGSRCVSKLYNEDGLEKAVNDAVDISFEKCAIIEEFLEGPEYSCECISYHGNHTMLAITKKFTTGEPHYIETGHLEPADRDEVDYDIVQENIFKALDSLAIKEGASHSEFKFYNGQVRIIEIGARMGGDYIGSDLVPLSTGKDFVGMVIDTAMGIAPDLTVKGEQRRAYVRFILNDADIQEFNRFRLTHHLVKHDGINYENINRVIDSSSRLGSYIYVE